MRSANASLTSATLAAELSAIGVVAGQSILLHASMRSLGWIEGGAVAVVDALRQVTEPGGTLVVSAMTPGNSDSSRAYLHRTQGMTARQRRQYRRTMPAFDPAVTASSGTGLIAEQVRTSVGAVRSVHPQSSFAAIGTNAERFMIDHARDCHYGEESPLAKLYDADAHILLLGVGYDSCTAFHLAEYRYIRRPPKRRYSCVVMRNGRRQWWNYKDVVLDDRDFIQIGEAMEAAGGVAKGAAGRAAATLVPMRAGVDFAAWWLATHRASRRRARIM